MSRDDTKPNISIPWGCPTEADRYRGQPSHAPINSEISRSNTLLEARNVLLAFQIAIFAPFHRRPPLKGPGPASLRRATVRWIAMCCPGGRAGQNREPLVDRALAKAVSISRPASATVIGLHATVIGLVPIDSGVPFWEGEGLFLMVVGLHD